MLLISCSQTKENKIIGTWIASPKHNSFLNSKNEMEKSIDILHSKGISTDEMTKNLCKPLQSVHTCLLTCKSASDLLPGRFWAYF